MAEREGFEPSEPVKVQQFSKLPDSATLAPLRNYPVVMLVMAERVGFEPTVP